MKTYMFTLHYRLSHKGWIFIFNVISLLQERKWLDRLKNQCCEWLSTLVMIIDFHHDDAVLCVSLINDTLSEEKTFLDYTANLV